MGSLKDLLVYQFAFDQAMKIFHLTRSFPKEEKFALITQIRNSSRSVCANLSEGYRKRQYEKHFLSKVSDADMENTETQVWLDIAFACEYLSKEDHAKLSQKSKEIGRLLHAMMSNPGKFYRKP